MIIKTRQKELKMMRPTRWDTDYVDTLPFGLPQLVVMALVSTAFCNVIIEQIPSVMYSYFNTLLEEFRI